MSGGPELMTHHAYDEPSGYEDAEPDGDGKPVLTPEQRKKRRWKIIRRVAYAFVGVFFVLPAIAFVITYFLVDVPSPTEVAQNQSQAVTYLYADGSPMGKDVPRGGNRVLLTPEQIPDVMKHAAIATEDDSFETNSGFDIGGLLRAVYNQATGGVGGGSTISQQYIKKATDNDAPTLTRKWTELAKSFKMNQTYEKKDIITAYLNIIYFGRGAYGVGAASQAFFHKDAKDLTFSEAALLAGLIQQPGRSENPKVAHDRWNTALDRMVKNNYITAADRAAAQFPTPIPLEDSKQQAGAPPAFVVQQVKDELAAHDIPEDRYYSGGFQVQTTIDPKAQQAAEQAATEALKDQVDENLLDALVAVDPKTGGVLAYYGGKPVVQVNGQDQAGRDWANTPQNPGSSMKPFDLTAFLKMGKGLDEKFDGSNNRVFDGRVVRNAGPGSSCSQQCTVAEAMERSANTVFYDMVLNQTHQGPVKEAAKEAGVKVKEDGGQSIISTKDNNISLGGGETQITPLDMASAYATFAANGQRRDRHFVQKVTNAQNEVAYEAATDAKPAFDSDADKSRQIAGNVTEALKPVIDFSHLKCPNGHECAGKTGTQQHTKVAGEPSWAANANSQTWMVGYTPSVSVAAWVGGDGNKPLHGKGNSPIYGSTIAGPMWQKFLSLYLAGKPGEKFDKVDRIGGEVAPPPSDVATTTGSTPPDQNTGDGDGNGDGNDHGNHHGHDGEPSTEPPSSTPKHSKPSSTPKETPTGSQTAGP
ncbi:transglycosylase domain-containing protein [Amycolatopsis australiensis]|uniref:Membrane carboxypeptidase (Penicillin-binding protein) n=1 Tax=Amycolatopsis australiensis TaxID=546364 RepID=A0A1K1Q507_9PSEU|nr:transglycosylase domain-containing protein [Amycolatopsis australiensis]SFW54214.1 Membrane carboxypeptidase (penicillin-binding protein) [Amycolatopsis australiensis]